MSVPVHSFSPCPVHCGCGCSLLQVKFFAPLPKDKLKRIARLLEIEYVKPNGVIFEQGDPGDRFYIVNEGKVRARAEGERGSCI